MEIEPGYYQDTLDPGGVERLVLRFPSSEILVSSIPGTRLRLEMDLRGSSAELSFWKPAVRRREGLLVLADEGLDPVLVAEVRVGVPQGFHDLEIHTSDGTIDVRDCLFDILATTESGDLLIDGALAVEASSVSGLVSLERVQSAIIRSLDGEIRCRDVSGHISAESQTGDVLVDTVGGNVVVISTSGDITVQQPAGRLRLFSGTGDIELEISGEFAGGEVGTSEGDISLSLSETEIELRCETLAGSITAPGCTISTNAGPRRCALHCGKGGRRLHVKSISGDIEIDR